MSTDALREHLLTYSITTGDFTLKSGEKTDWFISGDQTITRPEGMVLVADLMLERIPDEVTAIGGLTMGADPIAFGVAAIGATRGRMLKSFSVRKEAKGHGEGGRIAGSLEPGDKVLITEDVATRGTSLMEAVDAVREFGADVVMIMVMVDRGGSCAKLAADAGIAYEALLTAKDLGFDWSGGLKS